MSEFFRVAIIGARGYLGRELCRAFLDNNVEVLRYSHESRDSIGEAFRIFRIENPILSSRPDFSHVIYLSWSLNRSIKSQLESYSAAEYVSKWAQIHKIQVIFVSSMAAAVLKPHSNYGYYKKLAEKTFLMNKQEVIRLGTILPDTDFSGSALNSLTNLPPISKLFLKLIEPVWLPTISSKQSTDLILSYVFGNLSSKKYNNYTNFTTLQNLLKISSGIFSLKILRFFKVLLPVHIRDRMITLLDLSDLRKTPIKDCD
jgi:hypothetical protein